jgi:hypothetical protein
MKKAILIVMLFFFLSILGIPINAAFGTDHYVSVGGQSRIVKVWYDKEGYQHLEYFKDDSARIILLGEEIFDRDDVKVYDNYIENTGDWPKGYNRKWR